MLKWSFFKKKMLKWSSFIGIVKRYIIWNNFVSKATNNLGRRKYKLKIQWKNL